MTLVDDAGYTNGMVGNGFSFDGNDDYIIPAELVSFNTDYTIALWFRVSATGSEQDLLSAVDPGSAGDHGILLEVRGNEATRHMRFLQRFPLGVAGGVQLFSTTPNLDDNVFHHVVAMRVGTQLRLYIDGVLEDTDTVTTTVPDPMAVTLGVLSTNSLTRDVNGVLDDIRFYDRALSQSEIDDLFGLTGLPSPQEAVISRTWTATDEASNSSNCVQLINLVDTNPPTIMGATNMTVDLAPGTCLTNLAFNLTATDTCDTNVVVVCTPESGSSFYVGTTMVTCTSFDDSGNSITSTFEVVVNDTNPPAITCPTNITVECDVSTEPVVQVLLSTFAPGNDEIQLHDLDTGASLGAFTSGAAGDNHRGFTYGPDGNLYVGFASTGVRRFDGDTGAFIDLFVNDPVGGGFPQNMLFGPDGHLYVSWSTRNEVRRYDGTTGAHIGSVTHPGMSSPNGLAIGPDYNLYVANQNNLEILRFNAFTGAFIDQFATVGSGPRGIRFGPDGNLYVVSAGVDQVVRYNGSTGALIGSFVTSDLDDPVGLLFLPDGDLLVSNFGNDRVTRYNGTSGAFEGFFGPVVDNPGQMQLRRVDHPAVVDNCDPEVVPTFSDSVTAGTCAGAEAIARTWTATDDFGNSATCTQIITVVDTTAPMITCPTNTVMVNNDPGQCDATVNFSVSASDNCDTNVDIVCTPSNSTVFVVGTTMVECVATDDCGNTSTCTFEVVVNDVEAPMFSCTNEVVCAVDSNCMATVPDLTVPDGAPLALSPVDFGAGFQGGLGWTYRYYPAFGCGGTNDLQLPNFTGFVWNNPGATLGFPQLDANGGHPDLDSLLWAVRRWTSDYSGSVNVSGFYGDRDLGGGDGANVRIFHNCVEVFTALDIPGGMTFYNLTLDIKAGDTLDFAIDPKFNAANDDTHFDAVIVATNSFMPDDNCGVAGAMQTPLPGTPIGLGTTVVSVVVSDFAGNTATCMVNVVGIDTNPPAVTCPADVTVECDADTSTNATGVATATDNCDTNVAVTFSDNIVAGSVPAEFTIERTWTGLDDSGTSASCTQTIEVVDTTAPVFTCPTNVTLEC
ncbi:MAG: HYR domain-containing protein, partial [Verrucomicrobiota bacterium]